MDVLADLADQTGVRGFLVWEAAFAGPKASVFCFTWRGKEGDEDGATTSNLIDDQYFLIKEEVMPNGETKLILKDKDTGEITQRVK